MSHPLKNINIKITLVLNKTWGLFLSAQSNFFCYEKILDIFLATVLWLLQLRAFAPWYQVFPYFKPKSLHISFSDLLLTSFSPWQQACLFGGIYIYIFHIYMKKTLYRSHQRSFHRFLRVVEEISLKQLIIISIPSAQTSITWKN